MSLWGVTRYFVIARSTLSLTVINTPKAASLHVCGLRTLNSAGAFVLQWLFVLNNLYYVNLT